MDASQELRDLMVGMQDDAVRVSASLHRWRKLKPLVEEAMRKENTQLAKRKVVEEELPEFLARIQDAWCLRWDAIIDPTDEWPMQNNSWRRMLAAVGWKNEKITRQHIKDAKHLQHVWTNDIENRILRYNKAREAQDRLRGVLPLSETEGYVIHEKPAKKKATAPTDKGEKKRQLWEGFPITSVIRWMGADGWEYNQAKKVLSALDVDIADTTIRIQLRAGDKGERGEPAKLSLKQESAIYKILLE